jgi:hypothetical protein
MPMTLRANTTKAPRLRSHQHANNAIKRDGSSAKCPWPQRRSSPHQRRRRHASNVPTRQWSSSRRIATPTHTCNRSTATIFRPIFRLTSQPGLIARLWFKSRRLVYSILVSSCSQFRISLSPRLLVSSSSLEPRRHSLVSLSCACLLQGNVTLRRPRETSSSYSRALVRNT